MDDRRPCWTDLAMLACAMLGPAFLTVVIGYLTYRSIHVDQQIDEIGRQLRLQRQQNIEWEPHILAIPLEPKDGGK